MYPQQVHSYLLRFFQENECHILNDNGYFMNIQLTVEMDKKIMNRPYYWQYIESVNEQPNPAQVSFITDYAKHDKSIKGEVVQFGSPRLNQIFRVTQEMGSFVQMYEQNGDIAGEQVILTPWLGVNYKIAYCSNRTKESLYSLGINLMTGVVLKEFQETVCERELTMEMPDNIFKLPFIIKPIRALDRLEAVIERIIHQDDHTWAEQAKKRWKRDQAVLDYFYEGQEVKPECYEVEKKAIEEQFTPKVKMEIVNGGLFYLK